WGSQFGGGGFNRGGGADDFMDLSDLFSAFGGGGRSRGARSFAQPGQDYEVVAEITLEQAAAGTEVTLNLNEPEPQDDGSVRRVPKTLAVKVPKGTVDGQRLRLSGKGGSGSHGGPNGDLYVDIRLRPHSRYRVEGHDLYLDLPLAPWEAVLGAEVEVPTLGGRVTVNIKPGIRSGQKMRLAGKGMPNRKGGAGDLYLIINIVAPSIASERERALYEELAAISIFDPRANLS
ncbi:MAG: DnaJ C-terminal domain-containing protein, partial [Burkholderiaceae bacterium]